MLPHNSASEIFLGGTIFILSILCVSAHSSVSNLGCTCVVRIRQCRSEVTDNKVWIKSIWCIQEKFCLQNYGVASGFLLVKFFLFFILTMFRTLDLELSYMAPRQEVLRQKYLAGANWYWLIVSKPLSKSLED